MDARVLLVKIQYIGVVSTGIFWLFFTLDFAGNELWKQPRFFILVALLPAAILGLTWTNESNHILWSNQYIAEVSGVHYSLC